MKIMVICLMVALFLLVSTNDSRADTGKYKVVNFFTTWCPGCKAEIPELNKFNRNQKSLATLEGIALDNGMSTSELKAKAKALGIQYSVRMGTQRGYKGYKINAVPMTFVLRPDGSVKERFVGEVTERMLVNAIK